MRYFGIRTEVFRQRTGATLKAEPLPEALKRLMQAGGLFPLLEAEGYPAQNPWRNGTTHNWA